MFLRNTPLMTARQSSNKKFHLRYRYDERRPSEKVAPPWLCYISPLNFINYYGIITKKGLVMRILKHIFLSLLVFVAGVGAGFAGAAPGIIPGAPGATHDVCVIINALAGVFATLRILCFAGAAFILMKWGWEFISTGGKEGKVLDDIKGKGLGMVIGFLLLFSVGLITMFIPALAQCPADW